MLDFEGTLVSAAEIRVVRLPAVDAQPRWAVAGHHALSSRARQALVRVGRCSDAVFARASALLAAQSTLPLATLRSFYSEPATSSFPLLVRGAAHATCALRCVALH